MRWSVGIEAEGDRVLTREQVVELARVDATACLKKHLKGRVSPEPLDMEGVEPITGFRP